jgi:CRISPR-associated protein Csd1
MILQALAQYYDRLEAEGKVVGFGFEEKEIPFVIVLDREGRFVDLEDTRSGEGKKKQARRFAVPRAVKKTSGIKANLLWDNAGYVLGFSAEESEKIRDRKECFAQTLRDAFSGSGDEGIQAVLSFLARNDLATLRPRFAEAVEKGGNLSFRLQGDLALVCERPAAREAIARRAAEEGETGTKQTCLITGKEDIPATLHASIKGVWKANPTGASIVSFNLDAFESFGKKQGLNAPVGMRAEFAYTTALNRMLSRESRQKFSMGDATAVCWTAKRNPFEEAFAAFFGDAPSAGESVQDFKELIALYRSPQLGLRPDLEPATRFYVLGLSPNAARLSVRFWHAGTTGQTAQNIGKHFDDVEVEVPAKWSPHLPLKTLLRSLAPQGDLDKLAPNLAGDTIRAILEGTPYPRTLLAAALRRIRAERDVTYPRAALVKAVLVRENRFHRKPEKEVGMSLDLENKNPGYRLGRLFAALERIQERASPGINATIRDRFYGAASSAPVTAFPHLLKLKNHHLSKLENRGEAVNLEKLLGEIVDGISEFPGHLSLDDQGRFAVGYYHQRQSFFNKSSK